MHANSYVGIVKQEVIRILISRAKRLRVSCDEIDDLQQKLVLMLAAFEYDPAKSNGASLTTALTGVIDRQIKAYLRAKRRYQKRIERLQVMSRASLCGRPGWPEPVTQPEPVDLRMDLASAMASLSQRDRAICQGLADGLTVKVIAKQQSCGRDTVDRAIIRIRKVFTQAGLKAWIDPDYTKNAEQA